MKRLMQIFKGNKSPERNATSQNSVPLTIASQMYLTSLNQMLTSVLECPICREFLSPPIYQCSVGHTVCGTCRKKIKICPLCRQSIIGRNITIEHISNNVLRDCPNKNAGCKDLIKLTGLASHEKICPFRQYECIPGKLNYTCFWTGERKDILNHMRVAHPEMAEIGHGVFDLKLSKHETRSLPAFNEIFWYHLKRDSGKKLLYVVVAYIGPIKNACKYKYKWQVYSKSSCKKLAFTHTTISDTCPTNDLFNNGQAVTVSYKLLKQFMDNNNQLSWKLKICVV